MIDYRQARLRMVETQIARRGISDVAVLEAMSAVPREAFVPQHLRDYAYEDTAIPIAQGQTISQPYIVALMVSAASLLPGHKVLEIGTGSGYAAAVLAEITGRVVSIERLPVLADAARKRLQRLGYANVSVIFGDGTRGHEAGAPFDAILSAARSRTVPPAWKQQLSIGGRLLMPLGPLGYQRLVRIVRQADDDFPEEALADVRFVPLISGSA